MKNYIGHIVVWGMGVIIFFLLAALGNHSVYNIAILWSMCAFYFLLYYLSLMINRNREKISVSESGVFSGRAFGIFVNMFVLEYIIELYEHRYLCMVLLGCSIIALFFMKKDIVPFFSRNDWKLSFYGIYIAFNVLFSCMNGIIGFYWEDTLLVNVEQVTLTAKILLLLVYAFVSILSVIPNSRIMKIATRNEMA